MNYELGIMKKAQAHNAQTRFFMPPGEHSLMGNSYKINAECCGLRGEAYEFPEFL
jgi:hypothetical protein